MMSLMSRVYNGCPDTKLQALFDAQDKLLRDIRKIEPGAHCTYFPMEGKFQVHKWGEPLSGLCRDKLGALQEAHGRLVENRERVAS